jgi:shikimate kinase
MDLDAAYQTFCERPVVVEEKVDGANLGLRVNSDDHTILVQNRSRYISSGDHAQFSRVNEWVEQHRIALTEILSSGNLILYGEWCAAKHSISYHRLPGYFVAFDLFDIETGKFWSRRRFHGALRRSGIPVTPTIEAQKVFGTSTDSITSKKQSKHERTCASGREKREFVDQITALLETPSRFRNDGGTVEGVVLRLDNDEWLLHRYKVVRPDFVCGCNDGHWSRRPIDKQIVDFVFMQSYLDECFVFAEAHQHEEERDRNYACLDTSDCGSELSGSKLPAKEDRVLKSTPKPPTSKAEQKRQSRERQLAEHNLRSRRRRAPRCIMLMGLPGSGKSTFSQRLSHALSRDSPTVIANQDDLGRKQCIQAASSASRRTRVILDRCNLLEAERKEWWNCMHTPPPGEVTLVYFSADADTCIQRVQQRTNHATIAHGKGALLVQQLSRRMESPTEYEQKNVFGSIHEVRTFQEANDLLRQWGVEDDFRAPCGGDRVDKTDAVID